MAKRNALGRGLDSLISMGEIQTEGSSAINEIPVAAIEPNPDQPRTSFDEKSLEELSTSIRELGVVQPLTLRITPDGAYQIIAGERRWRAARMAGLATVPAYVRSAQDSEVTEMALIENIQREDLNAIEVALAFKKLIETYHLTQDRLSERIGKKRATIANHLRLLKLPSVIQLGLRDRKLDMGHARALLAIDDPKEQIKVYQKILKDDLSVRAVEALAKRLAQAQAAGDSDPDAPDAPAPRDPAIDRDLQKRIADCFHAPVKFARQPDGRGSITLKFASDQELDAIMALLDRLK